MAQETLCGRTSSLAPSNALQEDDAFQHLLFCITNILCLLCLYVFKNALNLYMSKEDINQFPALKEGVPLQKIEVTACFYMALKPQQREGLSGITR